MKRFWNWLLLAVFLLSMGAAPRAADSDFDKEHARLFGKNPEGLSLRLTLEKDTYRLDEIIPVTLEFENRSDVAYKVSTRTYDRSGRILDIVFHVDGRDGGFVDPIDIYFLGGAIGGGLGGSADLGSYSQSFTLNEWTRFDRPGRYRLYCTSTRVREGPDEPSMPNQIQLCSPIVNITILPPDVKEVARKIETAKADLDSDDRDTRRSAARTLRFLATRKSTAALIPAFRDKKLGWEAMAGFIGSRDRAYAKKILTDRLLDPDVVVTEAYVWALGSLSVSHEVYASVRNLPPGGDAKQYEHLHKALYDAREAAWDALAAALPKKRGRARAVALSLLRIHRGDIENLWPELAGSFEYLNEQEQRSLLESGWGTAKCPEFEPVLARLIAAPAKREPWTHPGLRSLALLRYMEFQPEKVRAMILDDMRSSHPLMAARVLMSLPDKALPELDDAFLENLSMESDLSKVPGLIERYATARILPAVIEFYKAHEEPWVDDLQVRLLSYWVKHDRTEGFKAVARAVRLRTRMGFNRKALGAVLPLHYGPDAENLALLFLDDKDFEVVADVVRMLGRYGSEAVIDPLLDRLEKTAEEGATGTPPGSVTSESLHQEIVRCFWERPNRQATGAWNLTEQQKSRLMSLLKTDYDKQRFTRRFEAESQ